MSEFPKNGSVALVGPEGKVKEYIEDKLTVKMEIESEAGGVTIALAKNAVDPSMILRAKDVVTAVGRGFSPERFPSDSRRRCCFRHD